MKNPLAYLKHIVKDPVNTTAEADARKAEIMPLFYGSAGILALGLILQIVFKLDFMAALSFIGLVGVAFCGFLFGVIKQAKERFEGLTCEKCHTLAEIKTPEAFSKYVSFVITEDKATFKGNQHPVVNPTNGVHSFVEISASASAVATVDITCPNCGTVKHLVYKAVPFKCHIERKHVLVKDYELVHAQMENAVRSAVDDYNDPEKRKNIPYTYQSTKNPNYREEYKAKVLGSSEVNIDYMGTKILFHKDVEEMLEHYFVKNELNGSLTDPAKSKK